MENYRHIFSWKDCSDKIYTNNFHCLALLFEKTPKKNAINMSMLTKSYFRIYFPLKIIMLELLNLLSYLHKCQVISMFESRAVFPKSIRQGGFVNGKQNVTLFWFSPNWPIRNCQKLKRKICLLFTKSFTRKLRIETSQFLLNDPRLIRPANNKTLGDFPSVKYRISLDSMYNVGMYLGWVGTN